MPWQTFSTAGPIERSLWLLTVFCALVLGLSSAEGYTARRAAAAVHPALIHQQDGDSVSSNAAHKDAVASPILGRLDIQKLNLTVPMLESYDPLTLTRGVGHIPGSAVPGGLGNLVLAGHRDTFFRPLRNVQAGMIIDITTPAGRWQYAVDGIEIVNPSDLDVLDIGNRPSLTLITCYPFNYIGAAPQRFIVHAHLLSLDPS